MKSQLTRHFYPAKKADFNDYFKGDLAKQKNFIPKLYNNLLFFRANLFFSNLLKYCRYNVCVAIQISFAD